MLDWPARINICSFLLPGFAEIVPAVIIDRNREMTLLIWFIFSILFVQFDRKERIS